MVDKATTSTTVYAKHTVSLSVSSRLFKLWVGNRYVTMDEEEFGALQLILQEVEKDGF